MTITRVLVAPLNYSHRQRGQIEAFQHVFGRDNVREFDFMAIHNQGDNANTRLLASAIEFKPDWIWLQVQGADVIHGTTIERIRRELPTCLVTHWMGDLRLEIGAELANICKTTHATLLSNDDPEQWDMYKRAGAPRVRYVQIGLDPEDLPDAPDWVPPFRVPPVVFCGGHYDHVEAFGEGTTERIEVIRALMAAGIDMGVVGPGWPADIPVVGTCHVKHQVHVYKRAKVALSINHFNNVKNYYSDRHLIALASGTPVVARYVPGLELEFAQFFDCMGGKTTEDIVTCVQALLIDPEYAAGVGRCGQHTVLTHHTWRHRIYRFRETAEAIHAGLP